MQKNKRPISVFLSSTYENLKDYRQAVRDVLHTLDVSTYAMEYFGASSKTVKVECLEKLQKCDIYIGIIAMQYGSEEPETGLSYTHIEYEEADQLGLEMLVYMLDEDKGTVSPKHMDTGAKAEKLKNFKNQINKTHLARPFTTVDNLAKHVSQDLSALINGKFAIDNSKKVIFELNDGEKLKNLFSRALTQLKLNINLDNKNEFFQKYVENIYHKREHIEDSFHNHFLKQRAFRCFTVIGQAGKGKTSLLCNMINTIVTNQNWKKTTISILLNAAHFNLEVQDIKSTISEYLSSNHYSPSYDEIIDLITNENILLVVFIDAVNEIKSKTSFHKFNSALNELIQELDANNQNVLFCISCRSEFWRQFSLKEWTKSIYQPINNESGKPTVEINNFNLEDIDVISQNYFKWYRIDAKLLGDARESCRDPIMLRYLCTAYSNRPFDDKESPGERFSEVILGPVKTLRRKEAFDLFVKNKHQFIYSRAKRTLHKSLIIEDDFEKAVSKYTTLYLLNIANVMYEKRQASITLNDVYAVARQLNHPDAFLDDNDDINLKKIRTSPSSIFQMFIDEDIIVENKEHKSFEFTFEAYFEYCLGKYFALVRWPKLNNKNSVDFPEPKLINSEEIITDFSNLLKEHSTLVEEKNFTNLFGALQFSILIAEEDVLYKKEQYLFIKLIEAMIGFGIQGFDWIQQSCAIIRETKSVQPEDDTKKGLVVDQKSEKFQRLLKLLDKMSEFSDFFVMWDIITTLIVFSRSNFELTLEKVKQWAIEGQGLQPVFAAQSLIQLSDINTTKIIETLINLGNRSKYLNNFWFIRSIVYSILELSNENQNKGKLISQDKFDALYDIVCRFATQSSVSFVRGVSLAALPLLSENRHNRFEWILLQIEKEKSIWCLWNLAFELQKWPSHWPSDSDSYVWKILDKLSLIDDPNLKYAIGVTADKLNGRNKLRTEKLKNILIGNRWQLNPIPNKMDYNKVNLTGFVYSPAYLEPATDNHIECRERLQSVLIKINKFGADKINWIEPRLATEAELRYAHSAKTDRHRDRSPWPNYVEDVKGFSNSNRNNEPYYREFTGPSELRNESFESALLCVGGVLNAIDYVLSGPALLSCSLGRFPGHLSNNTVSIFNNIGVGAVYAKQNYGKSRILIIDCDVHHGKHTSRIFQEDPDIMYFSMHIEDGYAQEEGQVGNTGKGLGEGYNFNIPYPKNMADEGYIYIIDNLLIPVAYSFQPELILISAGFDGHFDDSLTPNCILTDKSFIHLAKKVKEVANKNSSKIVTAFEGGYGLTSFANCFVHMVNILGDWGIPEEEIGYTEVPTNYANLENKDALKAIKMVVENRIAILNEFKNQNPHYSIQLESV